MIEEWYVCRTPGLHLRDRREIQLFGLKDQVLGGQGTWELNEEFVRVGEDSRSLWDQTADVGLLIW